MVAELSVAPLACMLAAEVFSATEVVLLHMTMLLVLLVVAAVEVLSSEVAVVVSMLLLVLFVVAAAEGFSVAEGLPVTEVAFVLFYMILVVLFVLAPAATLASCVAHPNQARCVTRLVLFLLVLVEALTEHAQGCQPLFVQA